MIPDSSETVLYPGILVPPRTRITATVVGTISLVGTTGADALPSVLLVHYTVQFC